MLTQPQRDPHLQVGENYLNVYILNQYFCLSSKSTAHLSFNLQRTNEQTANSYRGD